MSCIFSASDSQHNTATLTGQLTRKHFRFFSRSEQIFVESYEKDRERKKDSKGEEQQMNLLTL